MTDDESADLQGDGWSRFSAYELDLKARYLLGQRSVARVREAAVLIEEVLQKHPSYAPAYVTLAECYRMLTVLEMMPPAEVVPKMKAACRQALTLDATSAQAHAAFADVLAWEWNFAGAEDEYETAIRCGPQIALTYLRYAIHLAAFGRFANALDYAQRACDLDPLSAACEHARGVVHYWTRDYARALDCAHRAVAIAPQFGLGHHLLGFVCLHTHDYGQATDALERATSLSGASTFDRGYQAYGFGCAGSLARARQILEELVAAAQREYVAPLSIAHCYLGLGQLDEALTWIERAYVPGMAQWPYFLAAPFYEPLFRYKRFQSVVERIGLPRPVMAT
jgi:tetratricopeptide (TPR) repeat protein